MKSDRLDRLMVPLEVVQLDTQCCPERRENERQLMQTILSLPKSMKELRRLSPTKVGSNLCEPRKFIRVASEILKWIQRYDIFCP